MDTDQEREYDFELILVGEKADHGAIRLADPLDPGPGIEHDLFEAGCDDASLCLQGGELRLMFTRRSSSLTEAVASAVRDVWKTGIEVGRIEDCDPTTCEEVARQLGRPLEFLVGSSSA